MPLIADNVVPEVVRNVDTYEVTSFMVNNQTQTIHIQYVSGYMDGEQFVVVGGHRADISGDEFLAVAATPTVSGSLYSNIKAAVYAALMLHLGIAGSVV
jgi:hypothetical protein